jgi:GDP-L-fucose synthase
MKYSSKIYVAGHRGLVGSALLRQLTLDGYNNIITRTHLELDLEDYAATKCFFEMERPEYVILAAAKVGGIFANNTYPVEFLMSNMLVQANVFRAAHANKVNRLIFLGSSCIYPRDCQQPIKEEYLLNGPLEPTNRPYALAKIAGIEMCWSYNREYGTKWLAAMPTNTYGPGDNYDINNSHVMAALIRKIHEAKIQNKENVVLWGTGTPKREFLYVDDLAKALIKLIELEPAKYDALVSPDRSPLINIGSGQDLTVNDLAEIISNILGFSGQFINDKSMPDGIMRKVLDISRIKRLGWRPVVNLDDGIRAAYKDYLEATK